MLQEEPIADVVVASEHPVHHPVSPILADLGLQGEGTQLGQGDGREPVNYVEGGEDEEDDVPPEEAEEDLTKKRSIFVIAFVKCKI